MQNAASDMRWSFKFSLFSWVNEILSKTNVFTSSVTAIWGTVSMKNLLEADSTFEFTSTKFVVVFSFSPPGDIASDALVPVKQSLKIASKDTADGELNMWNFINTRTRSWHGALSLQGQNFWSHSFLLWYSKKKPILAGSRFFDISERIWVMKPYICSHTDGVCCLWTRVWCNCSRNELDAHPFLGHACVEARCFRSFKIFKMYI